MKDVTALAKLYFRYGAMGSSKTAQALITKFNYEERGMKVWLIKPALDTRDGESVLRSRIGLVAQYLGREDFLKKETATHSSIRAWRIPWTIPWGHRVRRN